MILELLDVCLWHLSPPPPWPYKQGRQKDFSNFPSSPFTLAPSPAQRDNLARIRDNQRRSRARRREYVHELEQRLRVYELQGVEASTEVQMAARRVAEENRQLRELLNRHGVCDDHIAHYLQSGTFAPLDAEQNHPFRAGDAGTAVQSLHHVMLPRRLTGLDQSMPLPVPGQSSRETSTASGSTTSSSVWEPSQPSMASYGHQRHMGMSAAVMGSAVHAQYPPSNLPGGHNTGRQDAVFGGQASPSMLNSPGQTMPTTQAMQASRPLMNLQYSLPTYPDSTMPHYGPPGSGC
ncbi:hypothetical protein HRG_003587 [Hirsutella rhossiliensis]|uniref:BZIP domain-containing protein n=1 Tax=Hirsutella rhossiliensis TaxID=111463 RepID=A0A9P8SLW6_9HYPO|nr:uncharacterized protein HRG_03587 [Hirsutella rhossiliensis]KAH0965571.1 hypothetical protein HRG_03587 [Hirsutella rhossiliensis]